MLTTMLAILAIAVMNVQCLAMSENKEGDYAKKKWIPSHGGNDLRTDIKELTKRVNGLSSRLILLIDTNSLLITKNLLSLSKRVDEMANNQISVSRKVDKMKSRQLSLSRKVDNITNNQVSLFTKVDKISANQVTLSRKVDKIDNEVRKFHPRSTQSTMKSTPAMTTSTTDVPTRTFSTDVPTRISTTDIPTRISSTRTSNSSTTPEFNTSTRGFPTSLPTSTPHGEWIYYPRSTRDHRARRFYPDKNLTFIGYGYYGSRTGWVYTFGVTFEGCISWCWQGRKDKGDSWDGLGYDSHLSYCLCTEHDTGHTDYGEYIHYRFHM